jgi:hypothetical protein
MSAIALVAGLILAASTVPAVQQPAAAGFCPRLAAQLGMKPNAKRGGKTRPGGWTVNLAGGLGPALFGGTFSASFSLRPIDETSTAESKRLENACVMAAKGMICKIDGPARLKVGTKHGQTMTDVLPGERAEVEMRGSTISCHDL